MDEISNLVSFLLTKERTHEQMEKGIRTAFYLIDPYYFGCNGENAVDDIPVDGVASLVQALIGEMKRGAA